MQFRKVNCNQCKFYQQCPQRTRLFVNYCASEYNFFQKEIQIAVHDCRTRRGILLTTGILYTDCDLLSEAAKQMAKLTST